MRNIILYTAGILILLTSEILNVYWIMPFPGSQVEETISKAYFIHTYIVWFRIIGLTCILFPAYQYIVKGNWKKKIAASIPLLIYACVFYFTHFVGRADKMFLQPEHKVFANADKNKIGGYNSVIGVYLDGQAKAYPIEIIGYHHQVQDTVGGTPVLVTYCTVCRSGRVFSPFVQNEFTTFRLVGMDHFNAMFEDEKTKSWWRQATGECIAGALKGQVLEEIPSQQLTIQAWIHKYPHTLIMQPDTNFIWAYDQLIGYDEGTIKDQLEGTDFRSWQDKSWVIGVKTKNGERVYDWNDLKKQKIIQDDADHTPLVIWLDGDSVSFHVFDRRVHNEVLHFYVYGDAFRDTNTLSVWNYDGVCIEGSLKGSVLIPLPAYQEFWHSWKTFHPASVKYKAD